MSRLTFPQDRTPTDTDLGNTASGTSTSGVTATSDSGETTNTSTEFFSQTSATLSSEATQITASSSLGGQPGAAATASSQSTTTNKGSGISTGAIAGAAVGAFIAGAIIAGIIAVLFMKKRSNRRPRPVAGAFTTPSRESSFPEKGVAAVTVAPVATGFDFLPQQADDADVSQKISTLADQIQLHVENFYQDTQVQMTPALESELSRFETSLLSAPLAACFEATNRPTVLIKHCLAFHIFNLTVAPGKCTQPLLPPELAGTVAAAYTKTTSTSATKDDVQAFTQWKRLTAYLRPDLFNTSSNTVPGDQGETASRIAAHFTTVFGPWANTQFPENRRSKHLSELVEQAIKSAVWLFSQPDGYRFDWASNVDVRDRSRSQGGAPVVVAPAMWKVSHAGAVLARPMSMLNAVTKRV